jgi:hypothetical protein
MNSVIFHCNSPYQSTTTPYYPPLQPSLRRKVEVVQPATCAEYLEAMAAVRRACDEEGTVPLYHYTMLAVAPIILAGGFPMSTHGQGGERQTRCGHFVHFCCRSCAQTMEAIAQSP